MKVLLSHDASLPVPHFENQDGWFVANGPITKAQLLEAASAAAGGELTRYRAEELAASLHQDLADTSANRAAMVCRGTSVEKPATPFLVKWLQFHYAAMNIETVVAVFSGFSRVIEVTEFAHGTADSVAFNTNVIVRRAVAVQAREVTLVHNHPQHLPAPSDPDVEATSAVGFALAAVGIILTDHWIIGHTEWASVRELGLLRDYRKELDDLVGSAQIGHGK